MRHLKLALLAFAAALPFAFSRSPAVEAKPLEDVWDGKTFTAHEWGTFTTVQGSDGVVLDGLRHEEHGLPEFVHDIRDRAGVAARSAKMETPVIYFYSDKQRWVDVNVKFPRGLITQWYPAANEVNLVDKDGEKKKAPEGREITDLKDGYIRWSVKVMAPGSDKGAVRCGPAPTIFRAPEVAADDPWRFCREVDANFLRQCQVPALNAEESVATSRGYEYEKCLFYRGLGDFPLPLKAEVASETYGEYPLTRADGKVVGTMRQNVVSLKLTNTRPEEALAHALIVYRHGDYAGYHYIGEIKDQWTDSQLVIALKGVEESTPELISLLAEKLTTTGLFTKEALAMVHTWQEGYFKDEGLRVLYMLPTQFIERELPLAISAGDAGTYGMPKNEKTFPTVRTFVARCELLSPQREAEMTALVESAASGDQDALVAIEKWGRFGIPYLNRAKALCKDEATLNLVDKKLEELKLKR